MNLRNMKAAGISYRGRNKFSRGPPPQFSEGATRNFAEKLTFKPFKTVFNIFNSILIIVIIIRINRGHAVA
jgi:hypothetical protein